VPRASLADSRGTFRPLLFLTTPVLAEESMTLLVTWTDWYLTGRLLSSGGDDIKAAMGLMAYAMWLIPSLFSAISIGSVAIIARRYGAREFEKGRDVANQAILIGLAVAAVLTAAVAVFGKAFVGLMGLEGAAANYACQYLNIIYPIIPLIMFEQVGSACLRGAGDTITGFLAKFVVVLINIVASYCLVTGVGGLGAWGWQGIALGTAIGHGVGGLILLVALIRGRAGLGLSFRRLRPDWEIIKGLFRVGTPGGLDIVLLVASQLVFVRIINGLGVAAAAAHGLAVQLEACAYLPANAFAVAAATMTGQYLGAGQPQRAVRGVLLCNITAVVFISLAGVFLFFGGNGFVTFFTAQPEHPTTLKVVELLQVVTLALPPLAVLMVTTGALRGAGDTVWPLANTLVGLALVRIPLALFLAKETISLPILGIEIDGMGLGVNGAWYAMIVDILVRCVVIVFRFRNGGWKHRKV
jgi:putative MATE family efflux protein